ncbi:MAG: CopG family transcriptional regulator [Saprospiraceae bacterium]|nr:MAG: CopG family transcriptional regulator [Saprospiraceae bacterium]
MKNTATFTSTLPVDLLEQLNAVAGKLNVPKNRLIEKSLRLYFEHLKRLELIRSFQRAAQDKDILELAEAGFADYLESVDKL